MPVVYCVQSMSSETRKHWFGSKAKAVEFIRKERGDVDYIDDEPTKHVVPESKEALLHWLNTYCSEGTV